MKIYDNFNDEYYDLYYERLLHHQVHVPKALHSPNPVPEQLDVAHVAKENPTPDKFFWRPMRSGNMDTNQDIFMNYIFRYSFRN